ncbi:MAG: hypothetical protein WA888_12400 [Burkholderiaceae bacterium]
MKEAIVITVFSAILALASHSSNLMEQPVSPTITANGSIKAG